MCNELCNIFRVWQGKPCKAEKTEYQLRRVSTAFPGFVQSAQKPGRNFGKWRGTGPEETFFGAQRKNWHSRE